MNPQEAFEFLFTFCHKGRVICISEVIDISPGNLYIDICYFQCCLFPPKDLSVITLDQRVSFTMCYSVNLLVMSPH